jgi:hypothetical protein
MISYKNPWLISTMGVLVTLVKITKYVDLLVKITKIHLEQNYRRVLVFHKKSLNINKLRKNKKLALGLQQ